MNAPLVNARPVPLEAVPDALFAGAPFQSSAGWWRCVIAAGLPQDTTPLLLLADEAGQPAGLLPLCKDRHGLTGLVTPYTCLFQPLTAPDVMTQGDLVALGRAFGRACAAWPVLRLDALDADWPGWPPLLEGFAAAGWHAAWFDGFGNWHAAAPAGWEAYLAARPGALRQTIRRKLRRAEQDPAQNFVLARRPDELAPALAAYQEVYRASWKPPEPYPGFTAACLAEAAAAGVLRLGVLHHAGRPLAAQYWIVEHWIVEHWIVEHWNVEHWIVERHPKARVEGRVATLLKLAHDETAKSLSPGTVLTAWMIRALLDEGVAELDFGRGDDAYKRLWATGRRQRRGLVLARPWRPRGAAALIRQALVEWRSSRSSGGPLSGATAPDLP